MRKINVAGNMIYQNQSSVIYKTDYFMTESELYDAISRALCHRQRLSNAIDSMKALLAQLQTQDEQEDNNT